MSSSDIVGRGKPLGGGRVILAHDSPGPKVTSVGALEMPDAGRWDEEACKEYFGRVLAKAQHKAQEIIAVALAEAEQVKARAYEEGRAEGYTQASGEVEAQMAEAARTLGQLLEGLRGQGGKLLAHQSADVAQLIRLAVAKAIGCELAEQRAEALSGLLIEALELIDSKRSLTLTIAPQDRELVESLLERATEEYGDLGQVRINESERIQGGVILESEAGLVDNTPDTRLAEVQAVLDQLSLDDDGRDPA